MLWVAILAPILVSLEFVYFRMIVPGLTNAQVPPGTVSPPIPAPFVDPDIIVVQPTPVETEPPVTIPESQRRPTGKHRAPESEAPPVPTTTTTRRIAPATPPTTSRLPVAPTGSTAATEPPTTSAPTSAPVTSPTPIYDTLRSETLATDPNLETVIPE